MQITLTGSLTKHVLLSMTAIAMCHRCKINSEEIFQESGKFCSIDRDKYSFEMGILVSSAALSPIISFPAVVYGLVSYKEIPFVIAAIEESTRRRRVTNPLVCFCLTPLSQTYHMHLSFITMPDLCTC